MLAHSVTRKVDVPHEPGEWFLFRKLSGKELEEAAVARRAQVLASVRTIGPDLLREIQALRAGAPEVAEGDPLDMYDVDVLLQRGVCDWSYVDGDGAPVPVTPESLADLDHQTRRWAAGEVLSLALSTSVDRKNA